MAGVATGDRALVVDDPIAGTYRKLVLNAADEVVGVVLVGDAGPFAALAGLALAHAPAPADAYDLLTGAVDAGDDGTVCSCHNVTGTQIRTAIRDGELEDVGAIKACTKAGTGCGGLRAAHRPPPRRRAAPRRQGGRRAACASTSPSPARSCSRSSG